MTVMELLEYLDGQGIIITDEDLIIQTLGNLGYAIFDKLRIFAPYEKHLLEQIGE